MQDKLFVWERPLRKTDLAELGDAAPSGPVLGARVPDEGAKPALIADEPGRLLHDVATSTATRPCCAGSTSSTSEALTELAAEAWACRAPRRLLAEHPLAPR